MRRLIRFAVFAGVLATMANVGTRVCHCLACNPLPSTATVSSTLSSVEADPRVPSRLALLGMVEHFARWDAQPIPSSGTPNSHDTPVSAQPDDREADHDALREFRSRFEKAASENQLDVLKPFLHEPFSIVTYTDREFTDFEAFKARWQKTRDEIVGSGSYQVTLLPERSEIYGDIAVAHGDSKSVLVNAAGNKYEFTSHWTAVFRKVDGQWKVVRVHSSLDPFGNPMIIGEVKRKIIQASIGGAFVGLVLGGILAYSLARRRRVEVPPADAPSGN